MPCVPWQGSPGSGFLLEAAMSYPPHLLVLAGVWVLVVMSRVLTSW
jgi:hypothetical protein